MGWADTVNMVSGEGKGFKVKMGCECSYTGVGPGVESGVDSGSGLGMDIGKEVLRGGGRGGKV